MVLSRVLTSFRPDTAVQRSFLWPSKVFDQHSPHHRHDLDGTERLGAIDLLLWVKDGWLSGIEIVEYGKSHEDAAHEFPAPTELEPPRLLA
jgi:hypothetical protein